MVLELYFYLVIRRKVIRTKLLEEKIGQFIKF